MARSPETRPTLLARMRDAGDGHAWSEFVEIYGPLIYSYGRHRGLQDADASDLVQEVLRSVAGAAPGFVYDPGVGSFRGWLLTITRNAMRRQQQRARRAPAEGGTTHMALLAEQPDGQEDLRWEREHRERLFAWAAERVKGSVQPATWAAFWKTSVEHRPAEEVAAELGLTAGAVYIARSRVLARMRTLIATVEGEPAASSGGGRVTGAPG